MKVSLFDYRLPSERIAQVPVEPRDASRLLVLDRRTGSLEHRRFRDIVEYLRPSDLLVTNDTRVIPARVYGTRYTGGKVEVLFLEQTEERQWKALIGSGGKPTSGEVLNLANGAIRAEVTDKDAEGTYTLRLADTEDLLSALEAVGHMPTPPYISRKGHAASLEEIDRTRYQTVYAHKPGAVAAPTAGLHFTEDLLQDIRARGIQIASVTLHVGLGTFRPVKTDTVEEHVMHREYYEISRETADAVNAARNRRRRLIAVGTTTTRVLESLTEHLLGPTSGYTDIFIYPPYRFGRTDAMVTNFHLPTSTLLMMVSALAGREMIMQAYEVAIEMGYRFYSYGDAMLIL